VSTYLRHIGAILGAFCIWWSAAVVIGLALYSLWPPDLSVPDQQVFSFRAGVHLGRHWQNVPGNIIGFIGALYTFRALYPKTLPTGQARE
jgi:hypothetical protein